MYNITLICTVHDENGVFNLQTLYKAIETVNPEVIFEEIPPHSFDKFYKDKSRNNLETDTINQYLEDHKIEHIPVDYDFILPPSVLKEHQQIHKRVEARSRTYRYLIDCHSALVKQYGLKYLNSIDCIDINKQLDEEISTVLQLIKNQDFIKVNDYWNDLMEKRENEMLKNIYNYCINHQFERGLFFIGAAHRGSIINKIKLNPVPENLKINWNYSDYTNLF